MFCSAFCLIQTTHVQYFLFTGFPTSNLIKREVSRDHQRTTGMNLRHRTYCESYCVRDFVHPSLLITIGNFTRLICTLLYVMTTHAYIYTVACNFNSRLLSGHLGVVVGTLRGFFPPVRYGSVGVHFTRLRALCQGTLTSGCV